MKKLSLKKFMAAILSAAMVAGATTTAAPLTVEAATTPDMKSSSFTLVAGGAAKAYNATAATLKVYKIYKASVVKYGGKKVANISVPSSGKKIRLRALEVGNTAVISTTVRIRFQNLKTRKTKLVTKTLRIKPSAKAVTPVTPTPTPTPAPVEEAKGITAVKQTKANVITVTFADAKAGLTPSNFSIVSSTNVNMTIASAVAATDNKSYTLTTATSFTDGITYTVTENNTSTKTTFAASVGAVKDAKIITTTAPVGKETDIRYELYDANGIDVTPAVTSTLANTVSITYSGTYASVSNAASAPKVTLTSVGDKVTMTLNYRSLDGTVTFAKTQEIVCVDASKVSGKGAFYQTTSDDEVATTGGAQLYAGLKVNKITAPQTGGAVSVYFYDLFEDESLGAVKFDTVSAQMGSSIAYAYINGASTSTKYVKIDVNGYNVGTTNLIVTAVRNLQTYTYTIPVQVYDDTRAARVEVSVSRQSMTNAYDEAYYGTITIKAYNSDGIYIGNEISSVSDLGSYYGGDVLNVSRISDTEWKYQSAQSTSTYATAGGSHVLTIETPYSYKTSASVTITDIVSRIPTDKKVDLNYAVELSERTLGIADQKADTVASTTARLYATYSGQFVGYVRGTGETIGSAGLVTPSDATKLSDIVYYVQNGANYYTDGLWNGTTTKPTGSVTQIAEKTYWIAQDRAENLKYCAGNATHTSNMAKPGTYTAVFEYKRGGAATKSTSNDTFTVSYNNITAPKVYVSSTTVKSSITTEALSTDVDAANNTSAHVSISALYDANGGNVADTITSANGKSYVRYVGVKVKRSGYMIEYFVDISTTFAKSSS